MFHCFFHCHVCLSNLKQAPSRELPLTARKTVFSHLNWNTVLSHSSPSTETFGHLLLNSIILWSLFCCLFQVVNLSGFTVWNKNMSIWCCNIHAGLCDLLTVFSSETPLQCKLINTNFASIVYIKVVITATLLDTQSPWTTQLWCGGNILACQQALLRLSGGTGVRDLLAGL